MTEPEVAGSDPTGVQATAELDGDEWVVNAHKWFTTGANVAAFTTVFCVTEPEAAPHARCSMIIVPTDSPGYDMVRVIPVMGETAGAHCEIRLTDVRVPADSLLGGRGEAFRIAQDRLGPGRIYHCMRWLGQAQRAFDLMCERALERESFGSPLAKKQTVQNWIADSAAEIQAARLMTIHAAAKIDAAMKGEASDARVEIALIKFFGAQGPPRRDRPRDPGPRRARRIGRPPARADVPACALRTHLRRSRRGPPRQRGAAHPPRLRRRRARLGFRRLGSRQ